MCSNKRLGESRIFVIQMLDGSFASIRWFIFPIILFFFLSSVLQWNLLGHWISLLTLSHCKISSQGCNPSCALGRMGRRRSCSRSGSSLPNGCAQKKKQRRGTIMIAFASPTIAVNKTTAATTSSSITTSRLGKVFGTPFINSNSELYVFPSRLKQLRSAVTRLCRVFTWHMDGSPEFP